MMGSHMSGTHHNCSNAAKNTSSKILTKKPKAILIAYEKQLEDSLLGARIGSWDRAPNTVALALR